MNVDTKLNVNDVKLSDFPQTVRGTLVLKTTAVAGTILSATALALYATAATSFVVTCVTASSLLMFAIHAIGTYLLSNHSAQIEFIKNLSEEKNSLVEKLSEEKKSLVKKLSEEKNSLVGRIGDLEKSLSAIHSVIDKNPHLETLICDLLERGVVIGQDEQLKAACKLMKISQLGHLVNRNKGAALYAAAYSGNSLAIQILTQIKELDANICHKGYSALHVAIYELSSKPSTANKTVEALLAIRKCDPNIDCEDYTPINYAIRYLKNDSLNVLNALIAKNGNLNHQNKDEYTPLKLAVYYELKSGIISILTPPKVISKNNYYYEGSLNNVGNPEGAGICISLINNIAATFMGEFKNGLFHGKGTLVTPTEIYSGNFTNGKKDGKGLLRTINGEFFEVNYQMGVKQDKETKIIELLKSDPLTALTKEADELATIESFEIISPKTPESEKKKNISNKSQMIRVKGADKSGRYFDGTLVQTTNKATGFGTIINATHVYVGNFVDGKMTGNLGVLYYKNTNQSYIGDFNQSLRHGQVLIEKLDHYIIGQFVDDHLKNGMLVTDQGIIYKGTFEEEQMTGPGTKIFPTGKIINTNFSGGSVGKSGTITYPETAIQKTYVGTISETHAKGIGKLEFRNGDIYVGEVREDLPHGKGKITYVNGSIFEGEFKQGKKQH